MTKRVAFLLVCITAILFALTGKSNTLSENEEIESPVAWRSHLMLNDQLYWSSAYPPDFVFYEGNFVCIGEVEEEVRDTPTQNFQAYDIPQGSQIYYDSQIPHLVYVKTKSAPYRYATKEASKEYICHNGTVYVSLSSICSWDLESYINDYVPIYGDDIVVDKVPDDAIYLGETKFAGYNMFVSEELETNEIYRPAPVYRDCNNPNILYAGDYEKTAGYSKIYVAGF